MNLRIDRPSLTAFRFLRLARKGAYYIAEPPVLGIIVVRCGGRRLEELAGLVIDAALGYERGVEGWCEQGWSGMSHGKATLFRVTQGAAELPLSDVLATWRSRYPMR